MKYIVAILITAFLLAGAMTAVVYLLFGADAAFFFAKLIAGPAGLLGAGLAFVVYDTLFPKSKK